MSATVDAVRTPGGSLLATDLRYARTALRRMRGLLGSATLAAGSGLWIEPSPSVHTAFMRYPIDVVFLDRDHRVVRIAPAVPPWRAVAAWRARVALELPAGTAARAGLAVGDRLAITSASERLP